MDKVRNPGWSIPPFLAGVLHPFVGSRVRWDREGKRNLFP